MGEWIRRRVQPRIEGAVGGPARLRVIGLLALVLGLDSANNGTVGAIAVPLEHAFGITNTQIGLLVTVSAGVGALATLPFGVLADHVNRARLLWIAILTWSAAMALSGIGVGYAWLLACRVALGAVVAVAGPVVASLIGDYFAPRERGRVYGFVLAGELVGAALGLVVSGGLAGVTWRLGFWWLAAVGVVLAVVVARKLPEPDRGGRSRIPVGAMRIVSAADAAEGYPRAPVPEGEAHDDRTAAHPRDDSVVAEIEAAHVAARDELILTENPAGNSLWWAVRYVLSIRTNVVLILASTFGYFFLTGLETFAVAFLRGRFALGQSSATFLVGIIGVGALIGVLSTGRIADHLTGRGAISARMTIAGGAFLLAGCLFIPALLVNAVALAVLCAFLAAIGLGGVNPPLDAGRLDIMHSRLWGRAESVRTTLRSAFTAIAPLLFGYVSTQLGGQGGGLGHPTAAQPAGAVGLDHTLLVMLVPLFVAGILMLVVARHTYPRDVATAVASERATAGATGP